MSSIGAQQAQCGFQCTAPRSVFEYLALIETCLQILLQFPLACYNRQPESAAVCGFANFGPTKFLRTASSQTLSRSFIIWPVVTLCKITNPFNDSTRVFIPRWGPQGSEKLRLKT